MNTFKLVNDKTPDFLLNNSLRLDNLLKEEYLDEDILLSLVEERSSLIESFLTDDLSNPSRHSIIEDEINNYNKLVDFSETLLDDTRQQLSQFVKSQSAIQKYK